MSIYVKQAGTWYEIPSGGGGLSGLGGWADITAVTGNPTKHEYTDADGNDWTAYEWKGNGDVTTTEGIVNLFMIGGGSGTNLLAPGVWAEGSAGRVYDGYPIIAAGPHTVTVGGGGVPSDHLFAPNGSAGAGSKLGAITTGAASFGQMGADADVSLVTNAGWWKGWHSSITGTDIEYGICQPAGAGRPNRGDGTTALTTGVGTNGVVIVRVPRANAKV